MLENYTNITSNVVNQFILINKEGQILDNDSIVFNTKVKKNIQELHPFFETLLPLINNQDKSTLFKCVNITTSNKNYIIDVTLKTFKNKPNSLIIIDDLTRHYNSHQKVAQLRNESVIKSQILSFKNQLLEKKEAFKNNFLTNFSHELRLPISDVKDICNALEGTELSQTQRYNLGIIKSTNSQLQYIINDILDISRIETNRFTTQTSRFDLFLLLKNAQSIYAQKAQKKGLLFSYTINKECPQFIEGDEYRLKQILNNLIVNAIKFTNKGTVKLNVSNSKSINSTTTITFNVKDTGIGIEKKKLNNIFTSFYQIANPETTKGTGLGLAITKQLIHALNGSMEVKSMPNKGSTFSVAINYIVSTNQTSDKKTETNSNLNLPKILIADASLDSQKKLKTYFNTNEYNIYFVSTGDAVIESLYKIQYNLVILNIKLPTMDGLDTLRYIRFSENLAFNTIPIIMVSNTPNKKEKDHCLNQKANDYIASPYKKEDLLQKVKTILTKKAN